MARDQHALGSRTDWLIISQAEKSPYRKKHSEGTDAAECPQRPEKEEPAGSKNRLADPRATKVNDRHQHREQCDEQHCDQSGQPLVEHHRSVDQKSERDDTDQVDQTRRVESVDDVIDNVERQKQ